MEMGNVLKRQQHDQKAKFKEAFSNGLLSIETFVESLF